MDLFPNDIKNIINEYKYDPLCDVRNEFHERLLLGDCQIDYLWEEWLRKINCLTRFKWTLHKLIFRKDHKDIEIVNEVKHLLFKRLCPYTGIKYPHIRVLFLGGEDYELIRRNTEIEVDQLL